MEYKKIDTFFSPAFKKTKLYEHFNCLRDEYKDLFDSLFLVGAPYYLTVGSRKIQCFTEEDENGHISAYSYKVILQEKSLQQYLVSLHQTNEREAFIFRKTSFDKGLHTTDVVLSLTQNNHIKNDSINSYALYRECFNQMTIEERKFCYDKRGHLKKIEHNNTSFPNDLEERISCDQCCFTENVKVKKKEQSFVKK